MERYEVENALGYVMGISAGISAPSRLRIGGTVTTMTGPIDPITTDQK